MSSTARQLVATSERDLFASGCCDAGPGAPPTGRGLRSAAQLRRGGSHRGRRLPDGRGTCEGGGPQATLTCPGPAATEIEREIDDLDRGVQLGAISRHLSVRASASAGRADCDPVQAPDPGLAAHRGRRSGRRVYVRTAERAAAARRVVQRHGHRASAPADAAGADQSSRGLGRDGATVAHDIKNPLTPIQLSESICGGWHRDRGEPLGGVLDSCTSTILSQVRLLRQIAGEFSSFATTPAPRPVSTDVRSLIEEVLQAYATGLEGPRRGIPDGAARPPALIVDRTLHRRAITNVIENALHAMPTGGRSTCGPDSTARWSRSTSPTRASAWTRTRCR